MHDAYVEANMDNISQTIPINMSNKPNIVENAFMECTIHLKKLKLTPLYSMHSKHSISIREALAIPPTLYKNL